MFDSVTVTVNVYLCGQWITHLADPVKLIAASIGDFSTVSPKTGPSAGTKLITPPGTPASLSILYTTYDDNMAVSDAFHKTTLPCKQKCWVALIN